MADIVERYLDAIASHDWDMVDETIADDIVRVGPYGDRYAGRDDYVAFLADLMPTLPGYEMEITRVTYAGDRIAFAELAETVDVDGAPLRTPECLTFELADDGRIRRVEVFTQSRAPV